MTVSQIEMLRKFARMALLCAITWAGLFAGTAQSVPLYARQMGNMQCVMCHAGGNFPELTPFGRKFKALGYSLGSSTVPLSAMVVANYNRLKNQNGTDNPGTDLEHDRQTQVQTISLFTGGKIVENAGAFVQWTYDPVAHHSALDNTDIRYAKSAKIAGADAVWGITLNNNPTVQDLYNSTPAWGYPYNVPGGAFQGFGAQPAVFGSVAHQVAGLGLYIDWNDFIYAELAGYRTASGVFSVFRKGTFNSDPTSGGPGPYAVRGTSPYWRLAFHGATGAHDWEVGGFGFDAKQYSDSYNRDSPVTRFSDVAIDGQYHYTAGNLLYTATGTLVHERQRYDSSMVGVAVDKERNTLNWRQLKLGLGYLSKYQGSVAFFGSSGSADSLLYASNTEMRPDTRGSIIELSYLPHPQVKLGMQYIRYSRFNGASTNYDASGTFTNRNASDNNTVSLFVWTAF
jgi:hypothetical protein